MASTQLFVPSKSKTGVKATGEILKANIKNDYFVAGITCSLFFFPYSLSLDSIKII
jgi:hypothetical protein